MNFLPILRQTISEVFFMNFTEELPLGFLMALAQNEPALKRFEAMSESDKKAFVDKARSAESKSAMRSLVNSLGDTFF